MRILGQLERVRVDRERGYRAPVRRMHALARRAGVPRSGPERRARIRPGFRAEVLAGVRVGRREMQQAGARGRPECDGCAGGVGQRPPRSARVGGSASASTGSRTSPTRRPARIPVCSSAGSCFRSAPTSTRWRPRSSKPRRHAVSVRAGAKGPWGQRAARGLTLTTRLSVRSRTLRGRLDMPPEAEARLARREHDLRSQGGARPHRRVRRFGSPRVPAPGLAGGHTGDLRAQEVAVHEVAQPRERRLHVRRVTGRDRAERVLGLSRKATARVPEPRRYRVSDLRDAHGRGRDTAEHDHRPLRRGRRRVSSRWRSSGC